MSEKKALVGNAADPEQVKKAGEKQQSTRDRELNDLREVLHTVGGRRFLWRVIGICAPMRNPFHAESGVMAFNVGMGEVGRIVLDDAMEANIDLFLTMFREGKRDDKERMTL